MEQQLNTEEAVNRLDDAVSALESIATRLVFLDGILGSIAVSLEKLANPNVVVVQDFEIDPEFGENRQPFTWPCERGATA